MPTVRIRTLLAAVSRTSFFPDDRNGCTDSGPMMRAV